MTDVHANLPALEAALEAIREEGCETIYHTGDAIGIGPQPAECLDLLLNTPRLHLLTGNHDMWFAHGLPQPQPPWMDDGEAAHQRWTHAQLDPALRAVVADWPVVVEMECAGQRLVLLHYEPEDCAAGFRAAPRYPTAADLDEAFAGRQADVILFGHTHVACDVQGRARYINPGSCGCHTLPLARFAVLTCGREGYTVEQRAAPYDDAPLYRAFEQRRVPERGFLYRAFFGGRFLAQGEEA